MTTALAGSPLLHPATLAAIRDLRLAAQRLVDGFLAGQHVSRRLAAGAEFSQFRSYGAGDDPRRIDWRLYARADRLYLREAQAERQVSVRVLFDATASMAAPESADDPQGKFAVARLTAAALGYLASLHGDAVSLDAVGGEAPGRSRSAERGFGGFLHALERLRPAGAWPEPAALLPRFSARRSRDLILALTDGWERADEMRRCLAALRALGHEVLVLRLLSPAEGSLPAGDDTVFEDAESGERLAVGGAAARSLYRRRFAEHRLALRRELAGKGIDLVELATDQPLDAALRGFLLRRQQAG